jgi:hypothetical protein
MQLFLLFCDRSGYLLFCKFAQFFLILNGFHVVVKLGKNSI